jgi:uncharacterized protein YyaL (SSP411 family)
MQSPLGGFFSAEDADSLIEVGSHEKGEGAFYVWRYEGNFSLKTNKQTNKQTNN